MAVPPDVAVQTIQIESLGTRWCVGASTNDFAPRHSLQPVLGLTESIWTNTENDASRRNSMP